MTVDDPQLFRLPQRKCESTTHYLAKESPPTMVARANWNGRILYVCGECLESLKRSAHRSGATFSAAMLDEPPTDVEIEGRLLDTDHSDYGQGFRDALEWVLGLS